jgi:hypothetical protein
MALSLQSRSCASRTTCLPGGGVNGEAQKNILARELVSDSRVLIEHARLLVRNSSTRIERVEKRLERFATAIEAAEPMPGAAGCIRRRLDRRHAA